MLYRSVPRGVYREGVHREGVPRSVHRSVPGGSYTALLEVSQTVGDHWSRACTQGGHLSRVPARLASLAGKMPGCAKMVYIHRSTDLRRSVPAIFRQSVGSASPADRALLLPSITVSTAALPEVLRVAVPRQPPPGRSGPLDPSSR